MNRPLKIHFFVQFVHEQGTYFRFHNLGAALARFGHEIVVFGCDNQPKNPRRTEVRDGVVYHIRPSARGQSWFHPFNHPLNALFQIPAARHQCDIAHLFQPLLAAAVAWRLSRADTKFYDWDDLWVGGLIGDNPSGFSKRYFQGATRLLEERLPKIADQVTTCSRYLESMALARGAKKTQLLYNGVNDLAANALDKMAARRSLGLEENAVYLGFMGRTLQELDWCFDLLHESMHDHPRLRLALCGPEKNIVESLPAALTERIDHLGSIPASSIPDFATAIDCGLLPLDDNPFNQSRFPIKFAEYMMGGTPVLASEVGECAELGRSLPWVTLTGVGKDAWIGTGKKMIRHLVNGSSPHVPTEQIFSQFSWDSIARDLERQYYESLSGS